MTKTLKDKIQTKSFTVNRRSVRLEARRLRNHIDAKGDKWQCWTPTGIELSCWIRMEPINQKRKRAIFLYDPSGSGRKMLQP